MESPPTVRVPPPLHFMCPLTNKLMEDPVTHDVTRVSYERKAILKHLEEGGDHDGIVCPVTGYYPISKDNIRENPQLYWEIQLWKEKKKEVEDILIEEMQPPPYRPEKTDAAVKSSIIDIERQSSNKTSILVASSTIEAMRPAKKSRLLLSPSVADASFPIEGLRTATSTLQLPRLPLEFVDRRDRKVGEILNKAILKCKPFVGMKRKRDSMVARKA